PLRFIDPLGRSACDPYYTQCGQTPQDPKPRPAPPDGSKWDGDVLVRIDGSPYLPPENVTVSTVSVISDPPPQQGGSRSWWKRLFGALGFGGAVAGGATAGGG